MDISNLANIAATNGGRGIAGNGRWEAGLVGGGKRWEICPTNKWEMGFLNLRQVGNKLRPLPHPLNNSSKVNQNEIVVAKIQIRPINKYLNQTRQVQ